MPSPKDSPKQCVAIIGSGIAGLSAAWLLSENKSISVSIYEKAKSLGLDANALNVDMNNPNNPNFSASNSKVVRIDLPLRVFSETYYPNLARLYDTTKVKFSSEDYCGSFCKLPREHAFFVYRNILIGKKSIPYVVPQSRIFSWDFWVTLKNYIHFSAQSAYDLRNIRKNLSKMTFSEYVASHNFNDVFVRDFLYPCLSAILTCSYKAVSNYPAEIILQYLVMRRMGGVRRVLNGTLEVVTRLTRGVDNVYLDCSITELKVLPNKKIQLKDSNGGVALYDKVIIATQANHALSFLKKIPAEERKALESFAYESSELILHTDSALMPKYEKDWTSVNFILNPPNGESARIKNMGKPMVSIYMNSVQPSIGKNPGIFQTWNPLISPSPSKLIKGAVFERPILNKQTIIGNKLLEKIQGNRNIWYCGAHVGSGMPLLENAVTSGLRVAEEISGVKRPWKCDKVAPPVPMFQYSVIVPLILFLILVGVFAKIILSHIHFS